MKQAILVPFGLLLVSKGCMCPVVAFTAFQRLLECLTSSQCYFLLLYVFFICLCTHSAMGYLQTKNNAWIKWHLAPRHPFTLLFRSPGCENTWDNHEDNSPLTPSGASLLGWTIWTERLIRLHARRRGFWGRPWRLWSSSWSATPGAPGTCVSLPLPVSSSSGPVFWLG